MQLSCQYKYCHHLSSLHWPVFTSVVIIWEFCFDSINSIVVIIWAFCTDLSIQMLSSFKNFALILFIQLMSSSEHNASILLIQLLSSSVRASSTYPVSIVVKLLIVNCSIMLNVVIIWAFCNNLSVRVLDSVSAKCSNDEHHLSILHWLCQFHCCHHLSEHFALILSIQMSSSRSMSAAIFVWPLRINFY